MTTPSHGPLHGLRVLDLTQMMAGPMCTMLLGDLGADIIKVEPPEGDAIRRTGDTQIGGETDYQLSLNRNKRSIVLDLKTDAGRGAVQQLARQVDIVVENFRPGTADRLGAGFEALRALNPRLIYCAMSGFGADSSNRDRPALDPIIQAMSGIMQLTGTVASGPLRTGFALADFVTPLIATIGIVAAVNARHATGIGQRVDLSMLDATIFAMLPRDGYYFATGRTPERIGNGHYQIVPYGSYRTADQRDIFIMAHSDKFWLALVEALGDPALADARLASNAGRLAEREQVDRRVAAAFATRTAADWHQRLNAAGALFSPVRDLDEVFADPEVQAGMVKELDHPSAGRIKVLNNPLRLSDTPTSIRRPPPLLGEHSDEIRRQFDL
ncbi:MAG: CoA transferase [Burkholderiales bacterium]